MSYKLAAFIGAPFFLRQYPLLIVCANLDACVSSTGYILCQIVSVNNKLVKSVSMKPPDGDWLHLTCCNWTHQHKEHPASRNGSSWLPYS